MHFWFALNRVMLVARAAQIAAPVVALLAKHRSIVCFCIAVSGGWPRPIIGISSGPGSVDHRVGAVYVQ